MKRPLHPPTRITLQVEGRFPGFPPDTIRVEPTMGTYVLMRKGDKIGSGQLALETALVRDSSEQ